MIARCAESSQFEAKIPPLTGCGSVWPSTRNTQCRSGGISVAISLIVTASVVICATPADVRSALPTGNNTSL